MFRFYRDIYLDNNATTRVSRRVIKRIDYVLQYCYGNPSSQYKIAHKSKMILEDAREIIAGTVNAEPEEIIFTSSATEANNMILKALARINFPAKKKIISTPIEHPSVIGSLQYLKSEGIDVQYLSVDRHGFISMEELAKLIDKDVFLICCMLANNELGTIQDLKSVTTMAKRFGIAVMSDCVQALGKINVDLKSLGVHYATFSAHKIHGPKGVGAVYIKEDAGILPLIHGGHQENNIRAGTESIHNIAGFAEACKNLPDLIQAYRNLEHLKFYFIEELKKIKSDIIINSPKNACLPNTLNITFPDFDNAVFLTLLNSYGIACSAGSACSTPENLPSHVLTAIGLSDHAARQSIRFSLPHDVSRKDLLFVLKVIRDHTEGRVATIRLLKPKTVDENLLFDRNNFIIDIRDRFEKKLIKSLPNCYEASFILFKKYLNYIPKNKNIVVVCQNGLNSPIIAYYLKRKGYRNVCTIIGGLLAWTLSHPEIYKKYGGYNVTTLNTGNGK